MPQGLNDYLLDPGYAVGAAVMVPFVARAFAAWYVFARVHGLVVGGARLLNRVDFPVPNDLRHELLVGLAWLPVAIVAGLGSRAISGTIGVPSAVWAASYFASAIPSVIWWFRRMRSDDRRSLRLRQQRLAEQEIARTAEALRGT